MNTFYVHPSDFNLPKASPEALRGGEAADNAGIARRILSGERGAARDIVLLNAGVSLLIAGEVADVPEGVARSAEAIDSGAAAAVLERLVAVSNTGSGAQ